MIILDITRLIVLLDFYIFGVIMKKITSVILLILIVALILSKGRQSLETPVLSEENVEKAYENVLCCAVRIQGSGHYGSGSILAIKTDEIVVVTNNHVLQYFDDDSYVTFFNGAKCKGSVIGCSDTADVGFVSVLRTELEADEQNQLRSVRKQEKAYETLEKNSRFFMIDMASDSMNPVWYPGSVTDKEKYLADYGITMLYGDGIAVPGMSGSGMFDYYGNYIGTLSGATEHYELAGVPYKTVMEEYKKIRHT